MAEIHIVREHSLGLEPARKLAARWLQVAQEKLAVEASTEHGEQEDLVRFKRAGANGVLKVAADRFELSARLGLVLGMFRSKIESEIVRNLDQLLAQDDPLQAFEQGLARHEDRQAARHAGGAHAPAARAAKR